MTSLVHYPKYFLLTKLEEVNRSPNPTPTCMHHGNLRVISFSFPGRWEGVFQHIKAGYVASIHCTYNTFIDFLFFINYFIIMLFLPSVIRAYTHVLLLRFSTVFNCTIQQTGYPDILSQVHFGVCNTFYHK